MSARVAAILSVCCVFACSDVRRGQTGESCNSRDDCDEGLACIELVCVTRPDSASLPDQATVGGECSARRDCQGGLYCIDNTCQPASVAESMTLYGGTGESCEAKNDCEADLSCVGNVCRSVDVDLTLTTKSCYRVECDKSADCCADFSMPDNCDVYADNCEMDPIFCNTFRSLCECNQDCVEDLCVASTPGCDNDDECMSQQTPFCAEGLCAQCKKDSNCPGAGSRCVSGVCSEPCDRNEQCPLLHACLDGICEDVGCTSDRECAFLTKTAASTCKDGDCQVPCERDTDCVTEGEDFQVCSQGRCVFIGCESDAECRSLLGIENERSSIEAVCR